MLYLKEKGKGKMKISDKLYNFLKWFALIAVPAFQGFWLTIGKTWGFPYLTEIGATIAAVGLLIAALIGVSTAEYNKPAEVDVTGLEYLEDGDDDEQN